MYRTHTKTITSRSSVCCGQRLQPRGRGRVMGVRCSLSMLTVLRLISFGHAGLYVYVLSNAQRWSKLDGPNSNTHSRVRCNMSVYLRLFGHLNFDHCDICRMDPESTSGVDFSYSPSRRVWERQGEQTEPFTVVLLLQ